MEIDFDIYDNLPENEINFEEEAAKLGVKVHELETHISTLQCDIEKLTAKISELKTIQSNLAKNISELYKTAKAEIDRKDRMIGELRSQVDRLTLQKKVGFPNKRPRDNSNSHECDLSAKKARKDYEGKRGASPHRRSRSRSRSREKCRERGGHERIKHKSKKEHHRDRERRESSNKESVSKIKSSFHEKVDRNSEDRQKRHNEESHAIKAHVVEENKQCRVGVGEKSQKNFVDKFEKGQSYKCLTDSEKISQRLEITTVDLSKKIKTVYPGKVPDQKRADEVDKINENVKANTEDEIRLRKGDQKIKKDIRKSLIDIEKKKIEIQRKNNEIHDAMAAKVKRHPKENQSYINVRRASAKSTGDDKDPQELKIEKGDIGVEEKTNVETEREERNVGKEENQSNVSVRASTSNKRIQQERRESVNENARNGGENLSKKESRISVRRVSVTNKKLEQEGKMNENGKSVHMEESQRDENVNITNTIDEDMIRKKILGHNERNDENSNLKDETTEKNNSSVENKNTSKIIRCQKTDEAAKQILPQNDEKAQDTNILEKRNTDPEKNEVVEEIPANVAVPEEKERTNETVKINIISDIRCTERAESENPTIKMQIKRSSISDEQFERENKKANANVNTKDADSTTRKLPDEQKSPEINSPHTPKNVEEIRKQTTPNENKTTRSAERNKTNKPKIEEVTKKLKARWGEEGNDNNIRDTFPLFETQTSENHIDKNLLDLVRNAAFGPEDEQRNDTGVTDPDLKKSNDDLKQEHSDKMTEKKPTKKDRRISTDSRSKKTKDTRGAEEDSPPKESDRVLRSATRRNGSGDKLEKSNESVSDQENQKKTTLLQQKDGFHSVNLTHEGDIPVLHISDSDKSPNNGYLFDVNLTTDSTSTPLNDRVNVNDVNMQLLRDDLNISQDQDSTAEVSKISQNSSMWNSSAKSDISGKSNNTTSSARRRRRVVITMID